jgi:hypothetical protein
MKTRAKQGFWPLRPLPAARSLELACWLAAAVLALALVLAPAPNPGPAAPVIAATAAPPAPHWTIYQQHCIERILARAADKTEEFVANQINQQCIAPFRTRFSAAAGLTPMSCERPFTLPLAATVKPVAGCLGG